jgi:hypothetical protein
MIGDCDGVSATGSTRWFTKRRFTSSILTSVRNITVAAADYPRVCPWDVRRTRCSIPAAQRRQSDSQPHIADTGTTLVCAMQERNARNEVRLCSKNLVAFPKIKRLLS